MAVLVLGAVMACRSTEGERSKSGALPISVAKTFTAFAGEWHCVMEEKTSDGTASRNWEEKYTPDPRTGGLIHRGGETVADRDSSTQLLYWFYDEANRQFVCESNKGTAEVPPVVRLTSPGWQNDEMIWTGDINSKSRVVPLRHRFRWINENEYEVRSELLQGQEQGGQWFERSRGRCSRRMSR